MKTLTGLGDAVTGFEGQPLVDPDGQTITAKSLIANALARAQSKDPVRAMDVALKFHTAKQKLELDDADVELAKQAVLADQALTNIAKAAALKIFEDR